MKQLLILFSILISAYSFSQNEISTKSKKAIKLFKEAENFYHSRQDKEAINKLNDAIKIDNKFIEAYLLKANIYHDNRNYLNEIDEYEKISLIDSLYSYKIYYFLGIAYLQIGKYENAFNSLKKVNNFKNIKSSTVEDVAKLIERADFGFNNVKNPKPFNPINLGQNINSKYNEYWPTLTVDEQTLVFTRLIPSQQGKVVNQLGMHEDFFYSQKKDDVFQPAQNMGNPLNTDNNEGAMSVSADGKIFFYTVCNRSEDYGSCDIYYSIKINGKWTLPKNAGNIINSQFWESNPAFSSDGKTLFFVSNRTGGFGKKDLWKAEITSIENNGKINWTKPVNLGNVINTNEDEFAPFMHPDNVTLFFTSQGHVGMGGADIFFSRYNYNDSTWSNPVNLGYPINTYKDESGMIVNAKGELAYFSSNIDSSNGLDLYCFELYNEAKPIKVNFVKGIIYDSETKQTLSAKFELYNLENNRLVVSSFSDLENGEYLVSLPSNQNYAFNANKDGYLFYSENFSLKDFNSDEPFQLDIPLQPIREKAKIVLKNIFYETDSYALKNESISELNKLVKFMNDNIFVSIEISGHTDNVGTKEHNIKLSENRAKSVYEYLVNKGVDKSRMTFKGMYYSEPIADNNTPEGRAKNRRTEFKITSIKK